MIRNIFFDFDGTLADTTEGIVQCTLVTLKKLGLPASTPERIRSVIGLPLTGCFARGTDTPPERIDEACATYRALFNEIAIPCTTLFPGTKEALAELQARGLTLALCTSRSNNSLNALLQVLDHRYQPGRHASQTSPGHRPAGPGAPRRPGGRNAGRRRHRLRLADGSRCPLPHLRRDLGQPGPRATGGGAPRPRH